MDHDRAERMPQQPTSNLFLVAGSFGLIAFIMGFGLIVAASLGFFH